MMKIQAGNQIKCHVGRVVLLNFPFAVISPLSYIHDDMYTAFVFVYMFMDIYFV